MNLNEIFENLPSRAFLKIGESEDLKKRIRCHEGVRNLPYLDSEGHRTIGVGHFINPNDDNLYESGVPISDAEITDIFEDDLRSATWWAQDLLDEKWGLPNIVIEVLIEMVFQLGKNGVRKFKRMWAALKLGNFFTAALEMRDSKWYRQTPRRAEELAVLMESADKEFLGLNKKIVERNKE